MSDPSAVEDPATQVEGAPTEVSPVAPAPAPPVPSKADTGVTIARNTMWLMIDSVVAMAASFYCSIMVARRLGPDFMGQYNYILYFATVLRMFTEVAIPATVRKFAAEFSGRGDFSMVKTLVSRALRLQAKLAGVGVTAGLIIVYKAFPAEQQIVATLAVLSIVPGLFLSIPTGALWATENLRHNVLSSLGATLVNLIGVTASVIFHWGLIGLTASLLASRIVDCILRFMIFRQQYARIPGSVLPGKLDPAVVSRFIRFGALQLVLALLYSLVFDRMEVFFLKKMAPTREIAFFSISFTLIYYLLQVPQNLAGSASVSVWVQQGRSPAEAARTTSTATWFIMFLAAPELFGVAAIADPLLRVMYGAKYLPAIPVLAVLAVFSLCLATSQPAQYLLVGAERQKFYILALAIAAVLDAAGNVFLIPHFGAVGAAFAKGIGEFVGGVLFITYMVVVLRATLPIGRMLRLLLSSVAMYGSVRLLGAHLPPLLALIVGIPAGAAVFIFLVRLLRVLDAADGDRLRTLQKMFPGRVRGGYLRVVGFLVPV
jgi:O-antigen/teichoic acid export membrane protein